MLRSLSRYVGALVHAVVKVPRRDRHLGHLTILTICTTYICEILGRGRLRH